MWRESLQRGGGIPSARYGRTGCSKLLSCEGSGGELRIARTGTSRANTLADRISELGSMWLHVDSSSSSPHGRGWGTLESQVEAVLGLSEFPAFFPGHAESAPQPVHSFLFRQNVPQQQSSIRTDCAATVDKAKRSARAFILA